MADDRAVIEPDGIALVLRVRVRVRVAGEGEQRVAPDTGKSRRGQQGKEAVREDRHRAEAARGRLSLPEQAKAQPRNRQDQPRAGHVGLGGGDGLVTLVEKAKEAGMERVAGSRGGGRITLVAVWHGNCSPVAKQGPGASGKLVLGPLSFQPGDTPGRCCGWGTVDSSSGPLLLSRTTAYGLLPPIL